MEQGDFKNVHLSSCVCVWNPTLQKLFQSHFFLICCVSSLRQVWIIYPSVFLFFTIPESGTAYTARLAPSYVNFGFKGASSFISPIFPSYFESIGWRNNDTDNLPYLCRCKSCVKKPLRGIDDLQQKGYQQESLSASPSRDARINTYLPIRKSLCKTDRQSKILDIGCRYIAYRTSAQWIHT